MNLGSVHITSTNFSNNSAPLGSAIYYTSSSTSTMFNVIFANHTSLPVIRRTTSTMAWICELGHFMPAAGDLGTTLATADFHGCYANPCLAGYVGSSANATTETCTGPCPRGHYCPQGSSEGLPCPAGTRWPFTKAEQESDCMPCFPGSFQNLTGQEKCQVCSAGSYTASYNATQCDRCPAGQQLCPPTKESAIAD